MTATGTKWRGRLGGLEEQKAPVETGEQPATARPRKRTLSVRAVAGGYAVFDEHGKKLSEVFARRPDAIVEAEGFAGGDGSVLVEGPTGHVESEAMLRRGG